MTPTQLKQKHPEMFLISEILDAVDDYTQEAITRKELQGIVEAIIIKINKKG